MTDSQVDPQRLVERVRSTHTREQRSDASVCGLCGKPIDPRDTSVWRRVVGWERKAIGASRKTGSDIVLREPRDSYAHNGCVHMRKTGVNPRQGTLV